MDVSVEINCENCGSANYSLPAGDADDAGNLLCNDCGAGQGSLRDLKSALLDSVIAHSAEALRRKAETLHGTMPQA